MVQFVIFLADIKFDNTISLGNIVTGLTFILMAGVAWTDLRWRVKNLETWRTEHMIDAESRDKIITKMDKILERLEWVMERRKQPRV